MFPFRQSRSSVLDNRTMSSAPRDVDPPSPPKAVNSLLDSLPLPEKYLIQTQTSFLSSSSSEDESTADDDDDDVKRCPFERERRRMFAQTTQSPRVASLRTRSSVPQEAQRRPTAHVSPSIPRHSAATPPPPQQWQPQPQRSSYSGQKRWNSVSNIDRAEDNVDLFSALPPDLNATVDQSRYLNEAEDLDCYKKIALSNVTTPLRKSSQSVTDVHKASSGDWQTLNPASPPVSSDQCHQSTNMYSAFGAPYKPTLRSSSSALDSLYTSSLTSPPSFLQNRHYPSSSALPASSFNRSEFSADLTDWQRQHQDQLRRQRMEISSPAYSGVGGSSFSSSLSGSSLTSDPRGLDAVKSAADNIIREKDTIIDKQKYLIQELEQHGSSDVTGLLQRDKQALTVKVQAQNQDPACAKTDLQLENASLRTHLADKYSSNRYERVDIEKKLGATECELQDLRRTTEAELVAKRAIIQRLNEQLLERDGHMAQKDARLEEAKRQAEKLQQQLDSQQRYLQDVPTPDEHTKGQKVKRDLREEGQRLRAQVALLEKKLQDTHRGRHSRDGLIESLERSEKELKERLHSMEKQKNDLEKKLRREDLLTTDEREELQELRYKIKKLASDLDKAKKLLENKHKKLQNLEAKHQSREAELKEQIQMEASTVNALRQQVESHEQGQRKLRSSLKELGTQNQKQMESNLALKEKLRAVEQQFSAECSKLHKRLFREMDVCFAELQSLVHVCVQQANGEEPNVAALLGAKGDCEQGAESSLEISAQALRYKVSQVKQLRAEVDKLQGLISNTYAEQMGEKLTCITH